VTPPSRWHLTNRSTLHCDFRKGSQLPTGSIQEKHYNVVDHPEDGKIHKKSSQEKHSL